MHDTLCLDLSILLFVSLELFYHAIIYLSCITCIGLITSLYNSNSYSLIQECCEVVKYTNPIQTERQTPNLILQARPAGMCQFHLIDRADAYKDRKSGG